MVFMMRERDCKPNNTADVSCAKTMTVADGLSNEEKKKMLDKFFGRHFTTLAEANKKDMETLKEEGIKLSDIQAFEKANK